MILLKAVLNKKYKTHNPTVQWVCEAPLRYAPQTADLCVIRQYIISTYLQISLSQASNDVTKSKFNDRNWTIKKIVAFKLFKTIFNGEYYGRRNTFFHRFYWSN